MKKIVSMLLVVLTFCGLVACGGSKYAHGSEKIVLKLGDHKVSEEVYRYFLLNTMDEMANGDNNYFQGADREEKLSQLEKTVLGHLKQFYSVLDLADECDIEMSEKELEAIDETMEALRADFESPEKYQEELQAAYLSEYMAYSLIYNESLQTALYNTMSQTGKYFSVDGNDILAYAKENFLFCRQFVVKTDDPATDEEAMEKAQTIHDRLSQGEDPADVLKEYESDDTVIGAYYCFAETEDFAGLNEEALQELKEGEISDIRMDGYGFHIIIRMKPDTEYLEDNLSDGVFESYCMHQMNLRLEKIQKEYTVTYKNKQEPEAYR